MKKSIKLKSITLLTKLKCIHFIRLNKVLRKSFPNKSHESVLLNEVSSQKSIQFYLILNLNFQKKVYLMHCNKNQRKKTKFNAFLIEKNKIKLTED